MNQGFSLVAGLGKTGLSIARYLHRTQQAFVAFDTRKEAPGLLEFKAEFPEAPVYLETVPEEVLNEVKELIASPGISLDNLLFQQAKQRGIAIYGDIECLARAIQAPVIAITGTNGKSTVTTLVGEMAKAAGFSVAVAGNIGTPVLDLLQDESAYDLWVLELSSFQLDLIFSLKPLVATILNVSADHLDRHHNLEAYIAAKQRIYQQAQVLLFNREDQATLPLNPAQSQSLSFGSDAPTLGNWGLRTQEQQIFLARGEEAILPVDALLIKGIHNWLNALAAAAAAEAAGISLSAILEVLTTFRGLAHRCEWVRDLEGVTWINDSKGTNVGATLSAIKGIGGSIAGKIVLIAGGQGKGADFRVLQEPVKHYVRSILFIGEDGPRMKAELNEVVPSLETTTLEEAVFLAKAQAQGGDVVLLSPACASQDMFRDFNHRGEVFRASVAGL